MYDRHSIQYNFITLLDKHLNMADDEFGELEKPSDTTSTTTSTIENNNCEATLNTKLKNLDIESEEDVSTGCVHYKRRAKFVVSLYFHFQSGWFSLRIFPFIKLIELYIYIRQSSIECGFFLLSNDYVSDLFLLLFLLTRCYLSFVWLFWLVHSPVSSDFHDCH